MFLRLLIIGVIFYVQWNFLFADNANNKPKNSNKNQTENDTSKYPRPKMFFFDPYGYLIINGHVAGTSSPIVLDYKKYRNTCTANVHFFMTFVAPAYAEIEATERIFVSENQTMTNQDAAEMFSTCPYGLTFCYEGQLDGEGVRSEYRVTNYVSPNKEDLDRPTQKISMQCMLVNDMLNAHGFNMAVVAFPGLKLEDIKPTDARHAEIPWKYKIHWRFFVLTLSITETEYYFIVPDDGRVMLQIGDRKSLDTYFTDSNGEELVPVQFEYAGALYGSASYGHPRDVDPSNEKIMQDHPGLWMLYLDFKRQYNEFQVISTVHSEDCAMSVEIRGNRMLKCRTYMEDIAVTDNSNATLDFIYTSEVGEVRRSDTGQEDIQEMLKKSLREDMRKTTIKEGSQNKTEKETKESKESGQKQSHDTQKTNKQSMKFHGSAKFQATVPGQSNKPPRNNNNRRLPNAGDGPGGRNGNRRRNNGRFGNFLGAARKTANALKQGAAAAGMSFLNDAMKNGLINDIINDNLDLKSVVDNAKKAVMDKVKDGIGTLKNLTDKVQKFGENLVNKTKNIADDLLKTGKDAVDGVIGQGKNASKQVLNNATAAANNFRDSAGNLIQAGSDKSKAYQDLLQAKAGQLSGGIGSLLSRSFDGGNGMFTEIGQKLGEFAGGGTVAKNAGEGMLSKLAGGLQNFLPPNMGGAMQNGLDKFNSLVSGAGSGKDDILNRIGGLSGLHSGGISGLKDTILNKMNMPAGGFTLANGKKFTENFLNMPNGISMPKSFDDVKNKLPGVDKLPSSIGGFTEKFKSTGGHLAERASNPMQLANQLKEEYLPKKESWQNLPSKYARPDLPFLKPPANLKPPPIQAPDLSNINVPKIGGRRKRSPFGGAGGSVDGGIHGEYGTESGSQQNTHSGSESSQSDSSSDRMFNDVSKTKSLIESFKSTTGLSTLMSNTEYQQNSQAFTKKETVDVKVSGLPPNRKIVISQMMFECDGNVIKLPKIIFHDGEQIINGLAEVAMTNKGPNKDDKSKPSVKSGNSQNENELQQRSMISKFLHDDDEHENAWDNLTLVERAARDPTVLFDDEEG